jgi:hypothetical protein
MASSCNDAEARQRAAAAVPARADEAALSGGDVPPAFALLPPAQSAAVLAAVGAGAAPSDALATIDAASRQSARASVPLTDAARAEQTLIHLLDGSADLAEIQSLAGGADPTRFVPAFLAAVRDGGTPLRAAEEVRRAIAARDATEALAAAKPAPPSAATARPASAALTGGETSPH